MGSEFIGLDGGSHSLEPLQVLRNPHVRDHSGCYSPDALLLCLSGPYCFSLGSKEHRVLLGNLRG